jgi:hypothetical protein
MAQTPNYTRIPAPRVSLVDPQTGIVSNEWFRFFNNIYAITYSGANTVTPGTYGSATNVARITVNDFGGITDISSVPIAIDATQIVSGNINTARIQGAYTGITGVGTLTLGTWNATPITTTYGGTGLTSYAVGDLSYYAAGTALSKLAIGSSTFMLTSSGTAPQWTNPTTITVGKATNLVGGAANRIAYQTAADTTSFIAAPTVSSTYLSWDGATLQWTAIPAGMVYPGVGIANSTGSAWGSSYGVSGTGNVALTSNPVFATDVTVNTLRVGLGPGGITSNVVMGNQALNANTTGANNVAFGKDSLLLNQTGNNNIAIGANALDNVVSTNDNIAIGQNALGITTGSENVAIGQIALAVYTGSQNVAIGRAALLACTNGSGNCAVGRDAGVQITTGSGNVCVGNGAGVITTGSNNTLIGRSAAVSAAGDSNSIVIGNAAVGLGTNTSVIGRAATTLTRLFGNTVTGLLATPAAAPTIASATTIAPTTPIVFVSGITPIATITAPAPIASGGGQITIIPTGIFTTTTAGNIALASTSIVSRALTMTYDTTTAKWYPSY